MNDSKPRYWENWGEADKSQENVANPIDAWIEIALISDQQAIRCMIEIVGQAIKRTKWELEQVPMHWTNVRQRKITQMSQWLAVQDKLSSLFAALDEIPF